MIWVQSAGGWGSTCHGWRAGVVALALATCLCAGAVAGEVPPTLHSDTGCTGCSWPVSPSPMRAHVFPLLLLNCYIWALLAAFLSKVSFLAKSPFLSLSGPSQPSILCVYSECEKGARVSTNQLKLPAVRCNTCAAEVGLGKGSLGL